MNWTFVDMLAAHAHLQIIVWRLANVEYYIYCIIIIMYEIADDDVSAERIRNIVIFYYIY